jgi:hypothetical protein
MPTDYHLGALRLLQECVSLERNDVVAIVYDESTEKVARIICESAEPAGIKARSLKKSIAEQKAFDLRTGLSDDVLTLFASARAILTCVCAGSSTTKFRRELVQQAVRNNARVGHMPGADLEVLESAYDVDFAGVERRCRELALALTVGRSVSVRTTYARGARECVLNMDIGGLNRSAVVSSGRIPLGRWGNIPGGETFIAPIENSANGDIALNGAFHGKVLKPGEALLLSFVEGRLSGIEGARDVVRDFEALFQAAVAQADPNWNMLAELGVGANDGVRTLKGVSLIDEKCLGTVHIALGDNTTFGGVNEASVHEDLVMVNPTLEVDGKLLLRSGQYVFQPKDWEESIDADGSETPALPSDATVWRGVVKARPRNGQLVVEIGISDGRLNSYVLGDTATTRLLALIYAAIPPGGVEIQIDELVRKVCKSAPEVKASVVCQGLLLLQRHRTVGIKRQHEARQ